jgi:hypothetical protein
VSLGCHAIQKSAKEPPCLCVLMHYRNLQSNTVFEFSFHPLFISSVNLKPCYPHKQAKKTKTKNKKTKSSVTKWKEKNTCTHTHKTKKTKKENNKNKEAKVTLVEQLAKEYQSLVWT